MSARTPDAVEARYQRSFGVRAGYLPADRDVLDEWHTELANSLPDDEAPVSHKSVQAFAELLDRNPVVRMYVTEMVKEAGKLGRQDLRRDHVRSVPGLIAALDRILGHAPTFNGVAFPMSALFAYMMMTPAGEAVFRLDNFNEALREMLREWCDFLNSPESRYVLNDGKHGWLSADAIEALSLHDYEADPSKPHWGFESWNGFFHRQIKPELRPVSEPADPTVIVSANDGHVYNFAGNVQRHGKFWAKGQAYSLGDMLNGKYLDRFIQAGKGADVIQSFLSGNDYHRFTSPIDGVVREVEIVPGLMFSDAETAGFDAQAGVLSQGYEVSVNTRALVFVESPRESIGLVCVIPIGITEVSSITLEVKQGDELKKGDPIGYFSFGGSTLCMVFQPGAIDHYTLGAPQVGDPHAGPPGSIDSIIKANARIAIAN